MREGSTAIVLPSIAFVPEAVIPYEGWFSDLPQHLFDEITHFFTVYKTLENKQTMVTEICGREEAVEIISQAIDAYKEIFVVDKGE